MFENKKLLKAVDRLKKGDQSALDVIYDYTYKLIYYQAYHILKDHMKCEDVVQETYMKVYENIHSFEGVHFKAWIVKISKNIALNLYHKESRVINVDDQYFEDQESDDIEDSPIIDLASEMLPTDEFLILMYVVVEEKPRREVAKILGLSPSGITYKLNQALSKLRTALERSGDDEK